MNDLVFVCKKCKHLLFVRTEDRTIADISDVLDVTDCPCCGEESYENWVYSRKGNYEEEFLNK